MLTKIFKFRYCLIKNEFHRDFMKMGASKHGEQRQYTRVVTERFKCIIFRFYSDDFKTSLYVKEVLQSNA